MRTPTLLKCQLLAGFAGIFLGLVCSFLVSGGLPPTIIFFAPLFGLSFYAIPTCLGILILRWLAGRLGTRERFTILASVLALAISFGLAYLHSLASWYTSRGKIMGTILGGGAWPDDIGAQLLVLASLAGWIALMHWIALAWKHARVGRPPETAGREEARFSFWLTTDCVLIAAATLAILGAEYVAYDRWSSLEGVVARWAGVLNDPGASAGDRALALQTLAHSSGAEDPRAMEAFRHEARDDTGENQMTAAIALLGKDDLLALSILEKPLLAGGDLPAASFTTTGHSPGDGMGVRTAGISHPAGNFGRAVERVRDPAAVPILVRLMASPGAGVREGAASALRSIFRLKEAGGDHWKPDWPATVDVQPVNKAMTAALDDSDEMVRYFAVGTLMETHGNPHYPAVFLFKDKETEELNYWKNPVGPDPLAMRHF